jgi:hypothetical protein
MKKYLIFLLLILSSCQKEELWDIEPAPKNNMIFESTISKVSDGQEFSFEVLSFEKHQLVIADEIGNVITKETFIPIVGLNTKVIYTSILPKGELILILKTTNSEISKTRIMVE